jgi:hypothetical protein
MKRLDHLLRRPFLLLLVLFLFLEYLPVSGKKAAALRLYENHNIRGDHTTYYVLQPDGDLIAWGAGPLDRDSEEGGSGIHPYLLRQKIARGVTSFTCMPYAILYVDEDHVLWGSGSDPQILQSEKHGRVRIMEDVKTVAADVHYALALKTDGTVWAWPGRDIIKHNQQEGLEPSASTPVRIAEGMQSIFMMNYTYFALTNENTLMRLSLSGGKPAPIAGDVKEVSLFYTPGKTIYQYLTRQGEVHTFKTRFRKEIAEQVHSLCKDGLLKEDHSLWTWEGSYPEGGLVKIRDGVGAAASLSFYVDILGRLHWVTGELELPRPSRSIRWLDPAARNMEVLFLFLAFLMCKLYQRRGKSPSGSGT